MLANIIWRVAACMEHYRLEIYCIGKLCTVLYAHFIAGCYIIYHPPDLREFPRLLNPRQAHPEVIPFIAHHSEPTIHKYFPVDSLNHDHHRPTRVSLCKYATVPECRGHLYRELRLPLSCVVCFRNLKRWLILFAPTIGAVLTEIIWVGVGGLARIVAYASHGNPHHEGEENIMSSISLPFISLTHRYIYLSTYIYWGETVHGTMCFFDSEVLRTEPVFPIRFCSATILLIPNLDIHSSFATQ